MLSFLSEAQIHQLHSTEWGIAIWPCCFHFCFHFLWLPHANSDRKASWWVTASSFPMWINYFLFYFSLSFLLCTWTVLVCFHIHPVFSMLPGSLSPALLIVAILLSYILIQKVLVLKSFDRALSSLKKHFRNYFYKLISWEKKSRSELLIHDYFSNFSF